MNCFQRLSHLGWDRPDQQGSRGGHDGCTPPMQTKPASLFENYNTRSGTFVMKKETVQSEIIWRSVSRRVET